MYFIVAQDTNKAYVPVYLRTDSAAEIGYSWTPALSNALKFDDKQQAFTFLSARFANLLEPGVHELVKSAFTSGKGEFAVAGLRIEQDTVVSASAF